MLSLLAAAMLARRPVIVGYVQAGKSRPYVDYARLTHLNVAFENPTGDSGALSFNPADTTFVREGHRHGVKVLFSLGGAGSGEDPILRARFAGLLAPEHRAGFVRRLAEFTLAHGFDGLDVDLEGASIDANYDAFVVELGRELHARHRLLTTALSMGNGGDRVGASAFASYDLVNVMAYDATGPWAPNRPGPHASLQFAKESVAFFLAHGVPRSRLVLGVPFYGHGFGDAGKSDDWTYAKILSTYPGAARKDQAGLTIWYNGVPTILAKARLILEDGLAGAMIWSVDQDAPGKQSLLTALDAALNPKR